MGTHPTDQRDRDACAQSRRLGTRLLRAAQYEYSAYDKFESLVQMLLMQYGLLPPETSWKSARLAELASEFADEVRAIARDAAPFEDVLGPVYMAVASQAHAQGMGLFFTPMSVARLIIALTLGDVPRAPKTDGSLWTVGEPALGAGGMLLAAMGHIASSRGTAALAAWGFHGTDLDLLCARMAAAQILMQCDMQEAPVGELVIWQGNSLTMEHRRLVVHAEHYARVQARAPVTLRAAG